MREIIFRGKDSSGVWLYGNLIDCNGHRSILTIDKTIHTLIDLLGAEIVRCTVNEDTIGQYTGLNDKNGVPIYEGDIIKAPSGRLYQVLFGEFKLDVKREFPPIIDRYQINGWCIKYQGKVDCLDSEVCNGEIIGNIHDNPELLEE